MGILDYFFKVENPSVEEIHQEFDTAESRIIEECDKILQSLNIPKESNIERKASMLESLGFVNSETVKEANKIKQRKETINQAIQLTKLQVDTIKELKQKYPFEKFITVDELNRICKKYNLIYAPVTKYIRDVPEKNVLEMKRVKPLDIKDRDVTKFKVVKFEFFDRATSEYKRFIKNNLLTKEFVYKKDGWGRVDMMGVYNYILENFTGDVGSRSAYRDIKIQIIDKSGLFISAPKTHFDLSKLSKQTDFGYFDVKTVEIKDPVVFEFCKNDICRIITKWGTDDDQSYLDSSLINEIMN